MSNSALEFIYLNPPVGCLNRPARAEIWWSTGCLGAFFWVDPTHYSWSVPPTALLVPVVSGCFQIANMTDWKMMKRCKANVNEHEVVKRWNIKIYIYNILYHPERIDGATAPPLPSEKKKKHGRSQTFRHWSWGVAIYFEHKPEGWTSTSTEPVFVGPFVLGRFKQSLPARRALGTGCFVLEVSQEESTCLPPQNFGNGQSLPKHVMITSSLEEKFHNKTRSQPCENVSNPCPRCA